jgi:hypothetical protein
VQVDAFAIRLRQRNPMEAADLGVRLCQSAAPSVFKCYLMVAVPIVAFSLASFEIAIWIPTLALWLAKPWLDRTILFVLSRAAFGQTTSISDLWSSQRYVLWSQLLRTWTTRRLSPWRSFTQPIYQLEGLGGSKLRKRVRQIRVGKAGPALLMTSAFSFAELAVTVSALSLIFWFAPAGTAPKLTEIFSGESAPLFQFAIAVAYALAVIVIEPFYVAAGFAMYLNRRVDLEAWDLEQEFRRADFARAA